MSVIRQDPCTKEWVIIATERGRRPHDFRRPDDSPAERPREASCPFCPGNEGQTPPEVFRVRDSQRNGWTIRVTSNKFPALSPKGELRSTKEATLLEEIEGLGYHEVIVETPLHNRGTPLMDGSELERILRVFQTRYRALREKPHIKHILIFKNHGEKAGTSLGHPHSQLVAMPVVPGMVQREYEVAANHYKATGRSLYADLVAAEIRENSRVILKTDGFLAFHPFASRVPFETWIVPRHPQTSFGEVTSAELAELGQVLRQILYGLYTALGNPDFNYMIHSAFTDDASKATYRWRVQILPRSSTIAGFELGTGIFLNTMLPEETALFMKPFVATD
ncbi:MAG: galactose-1-phosphate uridylyltransferase [Candidatus Binatia bacterium]